MGDVLLATPVLKRIREFYPKARVSFLVRPEWMPILELEGVQLVPYDPQSSVSHLANQIQELKCDAAVVLRDEPLVSQAVKKSGIPYRVGPYSSVRSLWCFNHGMVQRRSRCTRHEAEYNLQLLARLGIPVAPPARTPEELPKSWVHYSPQVRSVTDQWLKSRGALGSKLWCVHPGSSGSSRYLPEGRMIELLYECLARLSTTPGAKLILTGGPQEKVLLQKLKEQVPEVETFVSDSPELGLAALAELYRRADVVIAHGTGPLHLAAAMGARVLAIFPPLFVLSEKRWGPLTPRRLTWLPVVECPEKYKCRGPRCAAFDCMDRFEVRGVIEDFEKATREDTL